MNKLIKVGSGGKFFFRRIPKKVGLKPGYALNVYKNKIIIKNLYTSYSIEYSAIRQRNLPDILTGVITTEQLIKTDPEIACTIFKLLCEGLIYDQTEACSWQVCSGINAIPLIVQEINLQCETLSKKYKGLVPITSGKADRMQVIGWLLENFHFTHHAKYHIPPVLKNTRNEMQYKYWNHFINEEITHWKIYDKSFRELGWDINSARKMIPLEITMEFIDCLKNAAMKSQYEYAAMLMFIEKAPEVKFLDDDMLFSILYKKYGFSKKAINPLWIHACLNEKLNHDSLGAEVIASRKILHATELEGIKKAVFNIIECTFKWYDAINAGYKKNKSVNNCSLDNIYSYYTG